MNFSYQRITLIGIFFTIALVVVALRVYILAFGSTSTSEKRKNILRGTIRDRHGVALAVTEEASTIAIAPNEVYDSEQTAEFLSKYLAMTPTEILQRIYERNNRRYFYLKRQVGNLYADQIMDLALPGVYREREYRRHYPGKTLASNLLGFVGRDQYNALAGLEHYYNDLLLHTTPKHPHQGPVLQISIDSLLQYYLELEVGKAYESSGSKRATAILMNVESGAILALVSMPNFNPNEYHKSTPFQRGNWGIRLNYEPGSTIKVLMAAILLAEKKVSPTQRFQCQGEIHFHDTFVRCRNRGKIVRHGYLSLSEIIENSCNVGIIKAMQKIKAKRFYKYMQQLGFGKPTGILPPGSGETSGYFPALRNWVASTTYYMPIGQGFSVTPIQLLRATSTLVNGGKLLQPYIAWRIRSPEENHIINEQQQNWKPSPFKESINRKIRKMMRRVVSNGTGRAARSPGMGVMGKTGTGEKSSAQGYLDKYVVSFLGFFPYKEPRYGLLILFDEPQAAHSGGSLAAPVFSKFASKARHYLETRAHSVEPKGLPPQPVRHWNIKKERLYDFRGLAARDAVQIITSFYGLKVKLSGSGHVYSQSPTPGAPIKNVKRVWLQLSELRPIRRKK